MTDHSHSYPDIVKQLRDWSSDFIDRNPLLDAAADEIERLHGVAQTPAYPDMPSAGDLEVVRVYFSAFSGAIAVTKDGKEWRLSEREIMEGLNRPRGVAQTPTVPEGCGADPNMLPACTIAQWFLDTHQDIDLKHLPDLTRLVERARNDTFGVAQTEREKELESALKLAREYMDVSLGSPSWNGPNPYPIIDGALSSVSSTDPRCTCAAIVNPNIPHARSCPLSSTDGK